MKKSGVLLHISSLPSRGGIGTMGQAAYDFVDFVRASGMNLWQTLPISPIGYGESPYQSTSTFAGNALLIDMELLEKDGFLPEGAYRPLENTAVVDFERVREQTTALLRQAFEFSRNRLTEELQAFSAENEWLEDYALFSAIKVHFGNISWMDWPDTDLRLRKPKSLKHYIALLSSEIEYYRFEQYLFFRQWEALHAYAAKRGIDLMGDMPIYVSEDSVDVWVHPELFELDKECHPLRVSGVAPDYFQEDGQRWGNPLYRWDAHKKEKFAWWIRRLNALGRHFDILRIDHFIGFANYYAIPASEKTARIGTYETAPGRELFDQVKAQLPGLRIVVEDLGATTPEVLSLLKHCGYPGMNVMQYDVLDDKKNASDPASIAENSIVYTGTHDNDTTLGWWHSLTAKEQSLARQVLGMAADSDDILPPMLNATFESAAETAIIPMQDFLGLDTDARMNFPGTIGGNWGWRMLPQDTRSLACRIRSLNRRHRRGTLPALDAADLVERTAELVMQYHHVELENATAVQLHDALSNAVMLRIAPMWTDHSQIRSENRRAVYLSAEYLIGRLVYNNLFALGILDEIRELLAERNVDLAVLEDIEDAALGNGGLGRLAACFLDSAATHSIPLDGYGLRYRYGLFKQTFEDCCQHELPDDWSRFGDPWSIRRDELSVIVSMVNCEIRAVPYDMPVIGYGKNGSIGTLRLWQCESTHEFDFKLFNEQHYIKASENKNLAEDTTKLLYPNDSQYAGKLLRARQQYVMCSASLQDMLRTFKAQFGTDFDHFPDQFAIQLNDTHPTMAVPELIRLLKLEGLTFEHAFDIARRTFSYTNHTVMHEALERWSMDLLRDISPEMVENIVAIQARLTEDLKQAGVTDTAPCDIIRDNNVHMANLAVYSTLHTNGVAEIHSRILRDSLFKEWYQLYPDRFNNKTNGITQRRWLGLCNPELCRLLDETIGEGYLLDLSRLSMLRDKIDDDLARRFIEVKREKKRQLAKLILQREGVVIPEHFVFDVQVKRLHEYKRQLLNALSILDIYYRLKEGALPDFPPTAFIFGAKSAPGYDRAKAIIRFINKVAAMVNNDPEVSDRLRVVFVQNYNCSYAEHIIPAADLSEQISPAGTEASGTGNMKLMLNGACTLGTFDGANIEIVEQAGKENNFIFGATVEEINAIRGSYNPRAIYDANPRLKRAIDALDGQFDDPDGRLRELKSALLDGTHWHPADHHFLLLDYAAYVETKIDAIRATSRPVEFAKKCLYNIAGAGKFSSDRTIRDYAKDIWKL